MANNSHLVHNEISNPSSNPGDVTVTRGRELKRTKLTCALSCGDASRSWASCVTLPPVRCTMKEACDSFRPPKLVTVVGRGENHLTRVEMEMISENSFKLKSPIADSCLSGRLLDHLNQTLLPVVLFFLLQ